MARNAPRAATVAPVAAPTTDAEQEAARAADTAAVEEPLAEAAASNAAFVAAAAGAPEPVADAPAAEPARFRLPLDAFCAAQSLADRRVELIAAFQYDEKANGRLLDEHDAYAARYDAFARRPA